MRKKFGFGPISFLQVKILEATFSLMTGNLTLAESLLPSHSCLSDSYEIIVMNHVHYTLMLKRIYLKRIYITYPTLICECLNSPSFISLFALNLSKEIIVYGTVEDFLFLT